MEMFILGITKFQEQFLAVCICVFFCCFFNKKGRPEKYKKKKKNSSKAAPFILTRPNDHKRK